MKSKWASFFSMYVMVIVIAILLLRSCELEKGKRNLIEQLSEYSIKEKSFEVKRLGDSSTLATQTQTIMSQKEAIKLGLLDIQKQMKEIQSQVKQKSQVVIVEKPVPFIPDGWADTSGLVRNEKGEVIGRDSIAVPTRFKLSEKWFNIDGYVQKTGLKIDSLVIPNKTTMTIGYNKSGFLNLGRQAVVTAKNDNPYIQVSGMDNIVVKKKKKFWQSPAFVFGLGVVGGWYITK